MQELLKELSQLLEKHNAAIVRSRGVDNKLVVSKINPQGKGINATQYEFTEDITEYSINEKWYKDITKKR